MSIDIHSIQWQMIMIAGQHVTYTSGTINRPIIGQVIANPLGVDAGLTDVQK